MLSFVDNWDFVTWQPDQAVAQLEALLSFATMADLTVDRKKTFGWSTSPTVRTAFRAAGIPVLHHAKDLGAHIGFSRQRTNCTIIDRLNALLPFWDQLKRSKAGYAAKLRALRTVAWPRGLYAVESAPVSQSTWTAQRRKAIQALHFDKAGVNPLLLLGLVEAYVDPEFLALLRTVDSARQFCPLDFWTCDLFPVAVGQATCTPTSPVMVLFERLQKLGIVVHPDGQWEDPVGMFHPGLVNYTELRNRLQWLWQKYVAAELAYRKDFGGLDRVDLTRTRQLLANLPIDDQAYLRLSLAGGLFTQDAHCHWNQQGGQCKWCGAADSLQHRYFECPQTEAVRSSLAPDVCRLRHLLPDAMVLRSWAIQPPTLLRWNRLLASVDLSSAACRVDFRCGVWNSVFTDGSCLWPKCPSYRVASWGAVLACPVQSNWLGSAVLVLGSGPVPGLCQTAFRGELFALAFVLHHAACQGARVKIYSDCLGVVNKFHLVTSGQAAPRPTSANCDLWRWILESVEILGLERVKVFKTAAHKSVHQACSRQEAWEIWYNNKVDWIAKRANVEREPQFWDVWRQHVQAVQTMHFLQDQVWKLHLTVAKLSTQTDATLTLDDDLPSAPKEIRAFPVVFRDAGWDGSPPHKFAQEYGHQMARRFTAWCGRIAHVEMLLDQLDGYLLPIFT